MKKNLFTLLMMAAAALGTVTMVSCGEDKTEELDPGQKEPVEEVVMGHYSLSFNSLPIDKWPDTEAGILERYDAYKKSVIEALKIDPDKKYKWSEIEADKDRLQKAFNALGDFDYSVRAVNNYFHFYGEDITFKAIKEGSKEEINFGEKKLTCKLDVLPNTTLQLRIEIETYEETIPSAKEYTTKLRTQFTDALKEVFAGEYGKEDLVSASKKKHTIYHNIANSTEKAELLVERVQEICTGVKEKVQALPDDIKKDAQTAEPNLPFLFKVDVITYDPNQPYPIKTEKYIFNYTVSLK